MPTYASRRSSSSSFGSASARRCGKTPSSSPVRNTTGNSRPLAVWRVIGRPRRGRQVASAPSLNASSGTSSASATSETPSRKSVSVPSGGLLELTGDGDELGEVLDPALVLRVAALGQLGQVAGLLQDRLECGRRPAPASTTVAKASSSRVNAVIACRLRVASPGASSARASASTNAIRSRSDSATSAASARSPMPRFGPRSGCGAGRRCRRVGEDRQVRQRVLDLGALVELRAAHDLVRQADRMKISSSHRVCELVR